MNVPNIEHVQNLLLEGNNFVGEGAQEGMGCITNGKLTHANEQERIICVIHTLGVLERYTVQCD